MNSLIVGIIALICLGLGYKLYGDIIEKLWETNSKRTPPSLEMQDGLDYIPAKHWTILFGHHFSSIAGAGPIIGPVIAAAIWGWVPALIWIVFGSIFLGAVHDFSSLMVSLRQQGKSIAQITESTISKRAKMVFAAFLWLSLILIIAVFAASGAKTLSAKPQIVIPTFGLILVAVLTGLMMYKWKINQILATTTGILLLFMLIILGAHLPIDIGANATTKWTIILLFYALIASVLPVNLLLQPRDYLSSFVLFFGLFFGYLGILLTHPSMHTPAFTTWTVSKQSLWPMMFVIIACGAISGFHSLVAGGTTSKQLASEKDAKKIGYGAMITEGALAALALICVTAGLYFNKHQGPIHLVYPQLMKEKGWIVTFGEGYAQLVKPIFGSLGALIAITMLKTFIMTTLDSATRIGRYIGEEFWGAGLGIKIFKNRYFSTLIIIILSGCLALGKWKTLWPIFGAANQLIAALALLVVTLYLMQRKKPIKYTLYPALFMLITSIAALIHQSSSFFSQKNYLLLSIGIILIILTGFLLKESILIIYKLKKEKNS